MSYSPSEALAAARFMGLCLVYYRSTDEMGVKPKSIIREHPDLLAAISEYKHEILRLARAERGAFSSEADVLAAFKERAEPDDPDEIRLFLAERGRYQRYSLRHDGHRRIPATPPPDEYRDFSGEPTEDLVTAVGDYLARNPRDAGEPPGWLAVILWAHGLIKGKPTATEVRDALAERERGAA